LGCPVPWVFCKGRVTAASRSVESDQWRGWPVLPRSLRRAGESTDTVNGNWTYTYDDFNRLLTGVGNNGQGCSWDYDRYGNRWHQNAHSGTCPAPQYSFTGNNNRIDGASYDALGNLLYDGVHHYSYDAENRIISVDSGATAYTYDADGRRVAKNVGCSETDFMYDREGHIILINPANPTLIEMYAAGLHLATYVLNPAHNDTIFYYDHADWLGTERARTDLSGNPCEKIASLPFGDNQTITSNCVAANDLSPMHFTGKERDSESGLDYFGARYNSSAIGRWLSTDPAFESEILELPQSWNRYTYVYNRPLFATDPDGRCPPCVGALIGGVVEGGWNLGSQLVKNGGSLSYVNWRDVGANALGGAVAGALAGATGGTSLLAEAAAGAGADVAGGIVTRVAEGENADEAFNLGDVSIDAVSGLIGGGAGHLAADLVHPPAGELGPRPKGRRHAAKYDAEVKARNRAALRALGVGTAAGSPVAHFAQIGWDAIAQESQRLWLSFTNPSQPEGQVTVTVTNCWTDEKGKKQCQTQ
jgi:RHS repeat-associated protein